MISGHVFIATSLDGFIARSNGDIDWLLKWDDPSEDHGYDASIEKIDHILMGRGTYEKCGMYAHGITFGRFWFCQLR